jgi:hypothetical protein
MISGLRNRPVLCSALIAAGLVLAFLVAQVAVARGSIQFDLKLIGESIYEAHANRGTWPMSLADLEGTAYLQLPHRREILEQGLFAVVWQDLDANREANRDRILAYDHGSALARLGWIWACRGDLRIERISSRQVEALKTQTR